MLLLMYFTKKNRKMSESSDGNRSNM